MKLTSAEFIRELGKKYLVCVLLCLAFAKQSIAPYLRHSFVVEPWLEQGSGSSWYLDILTRDHNVTNLVDSESMRGQPGGFVDNNHLKQRGKIYQPHTSGGSAVVEAELYNNRAKDFIFAWPSHLNFRYIFCISSSFEQKTTLIASFLYFLWVWVQIKEDVVEFPFDADNGQSIAHRSETRDKIA